MFSFDELDTYNMVVDVCRRYGVDPSASLEAEGFFRDLVTKYNGPDILEDFNRWLEEQVQQRFPTTGSRPRWIQSAQWPILNNEPLVFVGQIDVEVKALQSMLHDDASLYVFVGRKTKPVVIMQQF